MVDSAVLDTIVAPATPAGRSALAVLRITGCLAASIARRLAPRLPDPIPARRPIVAVLHADDGAAIDEAVVTLFPTASSPTGEDLVEISMHGSPVALSRLLDAAMAGGARPARPGEFTERAFRSGRIDLVRAEAVRDLIESRTPAAALASARRLAGALSARVSRVRERLLSAAAGLTASIDFADDVGEAPPPEVAAELREAADALDRLASTWRAGRLLSHGCRVAILGRPNAGKSTLFNALLGRDRAIVTEVPGTTRDTLEAEVDLGGVAVTLVDTAGLRATEDRIESIGVSRAHAEGERADAVFYVFDVAGGFAEEDADALARLEGRPRLLVANKADRLGAGADRLAADADRLGSGAGALPDGAVLVCGLHPHAGETLRRLLTELVAAEVSTESASEMLGTRRQADLVARARDAARDALVALGNGTSPEYAATHCDAALSALADLVGETTSEDVLRHLFATFCIGK